MKKIDFDKEFIQCIADNLEAYTSGGFIDKPAIRLEYKTGIDAMLRDGEITSHQYNKWTCPSKAVSYNHLRKVRRTKR